jgi:hypothetical protein
MSDCQSAALFGFLAGIVATFLFVLWYGKDSSRQHKP